MAVPKYPPCGPTGARLGLLLRLALLLALAAAQPGQGASPAAGDPLENVIAREAYPRPAK